MLLENVITENSVFAQTPLDTQEIAPARLNIEEKARSNLLPWNGQFSPQFVEALLEQYAESTTTVLDPFCGSGTVLYESARLGLQATGIEVNPAAYLLAQTYGISNVSKAQRELALAEIDRRLAKLSESGLLDLPPADSSNWSLRGDELLASFDDAKPLERSVFETLVVLSDIYKGSDSAKVNAAWVKLKRIILGLPFSDKPIRMLIGDGRKPVLSEPASLVLTSPPYINVYNYHQQYRASAEALGWDLLQVARTEIGSNRKHRGNRFLTVIQYCLDLGLALHNLWDVTTAEARLIFVLGRESKVRGVTFFNGAIFSELALRAGYRLVLRQERVFTNRFGQRIVEDILHLRKESRRELSMSNLRQVATEALHVALALGQGFAEDVLSDIRNAIEGAEKVLPSPSFDAKASHRTNHLRSTYAIPHSAS
ncbi:DNA methyltransferase [Tepidimonas sp.]|uniref:DNA methyltransferase n=1 Tax=Tepidimonas sp. TaxID=2002775 RepID=UPI002FE3AC5B